MVDRIVSGRSRFTPRRHPALVPLLVLLTAAATSGVVVAAEAAPAPSHPNVNATPPELPQSAGLHPRTNPDSRGWTLVSSSSSKLWGGKGPSPFSSRTMGLDGGLQQLWVTVSTAEQFGVGTGLPLPVPLPFAEAHPGPIEATVVVLAFSTPSSPRQLLHTSAFTHVGEGVPGIQVVRGRGLRGGLAISISSAANGGLTEYQFDWVSASRWYQVSIVGSDMSITQAAQFAMQVGPPT
jgi:hypothetical protein